MPPILRTFAACVCFLLPMTALAQAAPPQTVYKIADNVYAFRSAGYQSLFVVTPEGVIVTDPSGWQKPNHVPAYLAEIRKITQAPIKYVIYSHHHYDHVAGGQPFKDAGATFIAHRNAKARLETLKQPGIVIPDEVVDDRRTIELGGTRVDLLYVGRNHSDNMLVVLLPKEKVLFAVDFIPIESAQFRYMADGFIPEWFDSFDRVLALDWTTMVPGHPTAGGRWGTKDDARDAKQYLTDVADAAKRLADEGKCYNDTEMRAVKLPKYEKWAGYEAFLFGNLDRFCQYYVRGI